MGWPWNNSNRILVDSAPLVPTMIGMYSLLSTAQAARRVGIDPQRLFRWIWQGAVKPPRKVRVGMREMWAWSEADVLRVMKHKRESYRKR